MLLNNSFNFRKILSKFQIKTILLLSAICFLTVSCLCGLILNWFGIFKSSCTRKSSFFSSKIFFCFSASVIAFACKSWHLSPKISSFEMYSSELWPICRFWLFLTTFVLLVLERSVLMPEQS